MVLILVFQLGNRDLATIGSYLRAGLVLFGHGSWVESLPILFCEGLVPRHITLLGEGIFVEEQRRIGIEQMNRNESLINIRKFKTEGKSLPKPQASSRSPPTDPSLR